MEIIDRIFQLLDEQNKRAYELGDRIGVTASTMSTWKTRHTDPPAKFMKDIASFFDVSLDYLLTGSEDTSKERISSSEKELLDLFRKLPSEKRYEFIGEIKGYLKALEESRKYLDEGKSLSV